MGLPTTSSRRSTGLWTTTDAAASKRQGLPMDCVGCLPVQRMTAAAATLGVTPGQMRTLLAAGTLVRLRRDVVVGSCHVQRGEGDKRFAHELKLRSWLMTFPDAVPSHESGALVLGLPLFQLPYWPIATRARGAWRGGSEGRIRIAPLPQHHLIVVGDLPCTTPPRTVVDVAKSTSLRHAAVVGDAALRAGMTRDQLDQTLDEVATWADVGRARAAIPFFDARSESPLESLSRVIMHEYKLPPPEPQRELRGASGKWHRVDFYWEKWRLIGEADGKVKYKGILNDGLSPEEAVWREKQREDDLRDADHPFVRWNYAQMMTATDATIARLRRRMT